MVVPVVVELGEDTGSAKQFADAGADFIVLGAGVFADKSAAAEVLKRTSDLIA